MKIIVSLFIVLLSFNDCFAASVQVIMDECRPDATFIKGTYHNASRSEVMKTYIGVDFPDQAEWDACEVVADLKAAKAIKIAELEAEMISRVEAAVPFLNSADRVHFAKQLYNSMGPNKSPTASVATAVSNYTAYTAAEGVIEGYTTLVEVDNYDTVNNPSWP